jgi:acyl carrier protein
MGRDDIWTELREIIRGVFGREDMVVTPKTSAEQVPGWDSFKMIEILMAIEERFSVVMETRDMDSVHNVGDLAARIGDKLSPRDG